MYFQAGAERITCFAWLFYEADFSVKNFQLEPLALLWTTFKSVKQRYGAAFMNRIVAHKIEIRYKRRCRAK